MHNLTWNDDEASRIIACDGEFLDEEEEQ